MSPCRLIIWRDCTKTKAGSARPRLFTCAVWRFSRRRSAPNTLTRRARLTILPELYQAESKLAPAEPLLRRALAIWEKALGSQHPDVAKALNNLAALYLDEDKPADAEPLYQRSIQILETALGPEHPGLASALGNLAGLYQSEGKFALAEPLYQQSLAIAEKAFGADHPGAAGPLNNLAALYQEESKPAEAEALYLRSLAIYEKSFGRTHPAVTRALSNLASLAADRKDWARAAALWEESTAQIERDVALGASQSLKQLTGKRKSKALLLRAHFSGLIKAAWRDAESHGSLSADFIRKMFLKAQWSMQSEAAEAIAQMAARGAKGDVKLAAVVRDRQDLLSEWQVRNEALVAAFSQSPKTRNREAEAANAARLKDIAAQIQDIDMRLKDDFAGYAALASPRPVSVEDVQQDLRGDEALIFTLDTTALSPMAEETFVWAITKSDVRLVRSDAGSAALYREVAALRCGLDPEAWAETRCEKLGLKRQGDELPFDPARAFRLYTALLGQIEDLIEGKHLLIVPAGPLTQLPFQVLVTAAPDGSNIKSAAWLIRDHALTVLPAVSSLRALRQSMRPSAATKPMIGFGNPLLDGPQDDPAYGTYYKQRALLARDLQDCRPDILPAPAATLLALHRGIALPPTMRAGFADLAFLRYQEPLPETANELCAVARDLHADPGEMRLGERATVREVKFLSASGRLAQYRIVHFATHGAVAGQVQGNGEPGLLMTPPAEASGEDDGYLTASDIAGLRLDADWVILSACNTAAGGAGGAEALSGLARAFIYAQARALLVSHWAVNSAASVELITGAMERLAADKSMARSEAMRQSMLSLIDRGGAAAQPAYWAPFVVAGEGGPVQ